MTLCYKCGKNISKEYGDDTLVYCWKCSKFYLNNVPPVKHKKRKIAADIRLNTNWCVECWPKKEYANFIFNGDSLCKECFNKTKSDNRIRTIYSPRKGTKCVNCGESDHDTCHGDPLIFTSLEETP